MVVKADEENVQMQFISLLTDTLWHGRRGKSSTYCENAQCFATNWKSAQATATLQNNSVVW